MNKNELFENKTSIQSLNEIQNNLTVSMIMTPRINMMVCKQTDTIQSLLDRNTSQYTFIPLIDQKDRVIGVLDFTFPELKKSKAQKVKHLATPLNEDLLIGGDASIYEFLKSVDQKPIRLVVSGNQVTGLVSSSDLQQLPVRVSIFSLLTNLELMLSEIIVSKFPKPADWMKNLDEIPLENLEEKIKFAKTQDIFVSEIALTDLKDKMSLVRRMKLLSIKNMRTMFHRISQLRNDIAHSKEFAQTPEEVSYLCRTINHILEIKNSIAKLA